jgi:DNA-binding transcriptional LysR family regulator
MIDEIRTFVGVVDAGSLSKVAILRNSAVSSVSRKIDAIERELGVKLLHRTSRMVMLTDAGEQFLPRARAILSELDDAKHAISAASADPQGLLSITAPSSFGRRHVSPAVLSFLKKYPSIEIDLHISDDVLDLRAQRVDVAIRIGVLPDSDLVATQLAPVHRLACASPAYLARHGEPVSPQQLVEHNCLTLASLPVPAGWWCFPGVNGEAALPVSGSLRSDDTETMVQAAVAGIGIVHLGSWLVSDAVVAGQLVPLFNTALHGTEKKRAPAIYAVRMPGRSHVAKAQLFIAHLREQFGDPPYWDRALTTILGAVHK